MTESTDAVYDAEQYVVRRASLKHPESRLRQKSEVGGLNHESAYANDRERTLADDTAVVVAPFCLRSGAATL